jgi:L-fuculose-phosphate aldolase
MSIKQKLVRYYRWLRQYGYNDSHSGNASVRQGNMIWVTPTGACADTLAAKDLVRCDIDGTVGNHASLDAALHIEVYRRNCAAHAILHSHGAYSVALTLDGETFRPVDFEGQYYFSEIPVLAIPYEDYVQQSPNKVASILSRGPIVVVKGHGVYAWGPSLNLAYKWTCSLEQSAKTKFVALLARTL